MQVNLILWLLVAYIVGRFILSPAPYEGFESNLIYDHYVPNQNAFRNFYRIGSELSKNLGWKPEIGYDHLRPENNECPQCFPDEG